MTWVLFAYDIQDGPPVTGEELVITTEWNGRVHFNLVNIKKLAVDADTRRGIVFSSCVQPPSAV